MARSTILCVEPRSFFRMALLGPNLDCSRGQKRPKPFIKTVGQRQNARSSGRYRTERDKVPGDGMIPKSSASAVPPLSRRRKSAAK